MNGGAMTGTILNPGHTDRLVQQVSVGGRDLIRKQYHDDAGETIHRAMADLWASPFGASRQERPGLPEPLAYDRAGRGLSDPASTPRDAFAVADDIFNMVNNAGFNAPIVLVGHSLGSYHVRAFANGQAVRTAGLVLVDPSGDGQVERFNAKIPKVMEIQKAMFEAQAKLNCIGRLRETPVPPDDPEG